MAQHTAGPPAIGFDDAVSALTRFWEQNRGEPADAVDTAVEGDDAIQDAVLAFLVHQLTPLANGKLGEHLQSAWAASKLVMRRFDGPHLDAFAEQVLFNLATYLDYEEVQPAVELLDQDELERLLVDRVHSGNELHVANALLLPSQFGYLLSLKCRRALKQAAIALNDRSDLNPCLAYAAHGLLAGDWEHLDAAAVAAEVRIRVSRERFLPETLRLLDELRQLGIELEDPANEERVFAMLDQLKRPAAANDG